MATKFIKSHILVVDDDDRLRGLIKKYLEGEGFSVSVAMNSAEATDLLEKRQFDIIVLDVMMPDETGIEFTKRLKINGNMIPILLLTALGEAENRIEGLESGADDYLTKPFEPRELCLRIENLLKRSGAIIPVEKNSKINFGDFIFNIENGELTKNGEYIQLTSTELNLLTIFINSANEPIARDELSKQLNGISERSVDVQVTRLRKKIEDNPKEPRFIQSDWGKGYVLRLGG